MPKVFFSFLPIDRDDNHHCDLPIAATKLLSMHRTVTTIQTSSIYYNNMAQQNKELRWGIVWHAIDEYIGNHNHNNIIILGEDIFN